MAWDFAAEIHALSNFDADLEGTTGSISGENLSLHTNQWLTDGAKEVINQLPQKLKEKCMTATGVGTDFKVDLDGLGEILYVTRKNADSGYYTKCRKIPSSEGGLATDSGNIIHYATATDPAYWVDGDTSGAATLYVKPTPTANQPAILHHIGYPTVAFDDAVIVNFPDEAEYLVVLYAAQKAIQHQMTSLQTNSDVTTALTAVNTELDETQVVCDAINTNVDSAVSELAEAAALVDANIDTAVAAIATALGRVNSAVALGSAEFDLVNPEVDLANAQVDDEDIELAQGYISTAQGYTSAGSNYISEAQASLSEEQGYVAEVNERTGHVSSQVGVAQGYIAAAQGFASELQSKVAIAQGYIAEANARLQADNQKYQWYQGQYQMLKQDYTQGLIALKGGEGQQ